jgi:hypothetical protein
MFIAEAVQYNKWSDLCFQQHLNIFSLLFPLFSVLN